MGSFAVQLINGVSRMVIFLSRSLGSVRVDITAGTVHPNPISMGTMLRPESPILRSVRSITKATRAMYPLSSSRERKRNSSTISGRKLSTLPTPSKIPSSTRLWITSFTWTAVIPRAVRFFRYSMPDASRSCRYGPIRKNVRKNTSPMIPINRGIAVYLPVSTWSIFRLLACSRLSFGRITHASHTRSM